MVRTVRDSDQERAAASPGSEVDPNERKVEINWTRSRRGLPRMPSIASDNRARGAKKLSSQGKGGRRPLAPGLPDTAIRGFGTGTRGRNL